VVGAAERIHSRRSRTVAPPLCRHRLRCGLRAAG
jgi:hypothetical protein